ncbi:Uncharacterised protein [uncultured archaeon]|nr:Uncharacterised protein [uncultured archaeon]
MTKRIIASDRGGVESSAVLAGAAHGSHMVVEEAAAADESLRQLIRGQDAETLLKMADYLKLFLRVDVKEDYIVVLEDREPSAWKRFASRISKAEAVKETVRVGHISRTYSLDWLFPAPEGAFIVEAEDDSRRNIKKMETIGKNLQREFNVPVTSITWMRSPSVHPGFPIFTALDGTPE